jgi:hypothetical protein
MDTQAIEVITVWNGGPLLAERPEHSAPAWADPRWQCDVSGLSMISCPGRAARDAARKARGQTAPIRRCACGCGRLLTPGWHRRWAKHCFSQGYVAGGGSNQNGR